MSQIATGVLTHGRWRASETHGLQVRGLSPLLGLAGEMPDLGSRRDKVEPNRDTPLTPHESRWAKHDGPEAERLVAAEALGRRVSAIVAVAARPHLQPLHREETAEETRIPVLRHDDEPTALDDLAERLDAKPEQLLGRQQPVRAGKNEPRCRDDAAVGDTDEVASVGVIGVPLQTVLQFVRPQPAAREDGLATQPEDRFELFGASEPERNGRRSDERLRDAVEDRGGSLLVSRRTWPRR
jgi:hypothetical protein